MTATKTPQICIFDNEKQYFCAFFILDVLNTVESFSTNEESDYEQEIWKKVLKSMRKVSNSWNDEFEVKSRSGKTSWTSDREGKKRRFNLLCWF